MQNEIKSLQDSVSARLEELAFRKSLFELERKASHILLRTAKIHVAITDVAAQKLVYVNPALHGLLKYSYKDIYNKALTDFVHPEDEEVTKKALEQSIGAPDNFFDGFINRYVDKTGKTLYIEWVENFRLNGTWVSFVLPTTKEKYEEAKLKFPNVWHLTNF